MDWLAGWVADVRRHDAQTPVTLIAGIEAKILDEDGTIDMPEDIHGVDRIYAADHRLPWQDTCLKLGDARCLLWGGEAEPMQVVHALVHATRRALERYPKLVIAHLFSMLPKLRLDESIVPESELCMLAQLAAQRDAWLEVDERWHCPSERVVGIFAEAGVPIVASSDAHRVDHIGQYTYIADIAQALSC